VLLLLLTVQIGLTSPPTHWWVLPKDHCWAGWSELSEAVARAAVWVEKKVALKAVLRAVRTDGWQAERWAAHSVVRLADRTVHWQVESSGVLSVE